MNFTVIARLAHDSTHLAFYRRGIASDKTPLDTRAWALQKRLLAPLTLLIYGGKPVWECQTAATCERRSLQIGGEITRYLDVWGIGDLKRIIQPKHNSNSIETGINWLRNISVYSQLKLTKASDCLPALSGLAAHFSQLMHGQNLYWLWTKGFSLSLLWFRKEYAQPLTNTSMRPVDIPVPIYGHLNYLTLFCAA